MGVQDVSEVFCTDESLVDKPGFYAVDKHGQINPKKFIRADAESKSMINLAAEMKMSSRAIQGQ